VAKKDLKAQNSRTVAAIIGAGVLAAGAAHLGLSETQTWRLALLSIGGAGAAAPFAVWLTNLLPVAWKHKLAFFRLKNEMAGHRVVDLCARDPRLTADSLREKWPALFNADTEIEIRNSLWYDLIYRPVRDKPEVVQAHRSFLLYRDCAGGYFVLLTSSLAYALASLLSALPQIDIVIPLLFWLFFVLLALAAQSAGNRMVVNAVAIALDPPKSNPKGSPEPKTDSG